MSTPTAAPVTSEPFDRLLRTSYDVITSLQDVTGAYPASPTFSAYQGYSWFRDGAFIADGISAVGGVESANAFHDWCARVVVAHAGQITRIVEAAAAGTPLADDEMLPTRFTFAGEPGTDDWWDFQLDGYGTWLWALVDHARRHDVDTARWHAAAALTVDYLLATWERPCFDWWEEHSEQVHTSTLGCIAAGLRAAADGGLVDDERAAAAAAAAARIVDVVAERGVVDGHLTKWLGSSELDGSLSSLISPLGLVDPASDLAGTTLDAIERDLSAEGGVYRFRADKFFGGGRWPLLTCFYGLARAARGERDKALAAFAWAASAATEEGFMPEQVDGLLLDAAHRQYWVDRWGPVATPLLWSHAMLLRLAADLGLAGSLTDTPKEDA